MKGQIYTTLLFITLVALASCNSNNISAPDMPEVQFTHITASRTTVNAGDTIHVHATVKHQCKLIQFAWSSSDGDLAGGENDVVLTAPSTPGTIQLSCTVTHPERIPETKTVTINVVPKSAPSEVDQQKKIGTPQR